jgi:hypothetical protein
MMGTGSSREDSRLAGIVRYGSYVPYFRLQRGAIGAGRGERAVASYDEDAASMGVEAAREALAGAPEVGGLVLATTSPPYAEKLNAATILAACSLPESIRSLELGGTSRAGLSALLLAADMATAGTRTLGSVRTTRRRSASWGAPRRPRSCSTSGACPTSPSPTSGRSASVPRSWAPA